MIAWFARNHVAANLLLITILICGLYSLSARIPLEVFPSFATDRINVNVSLRGATPEDVEKSISIRIEEAIQDAPDVKAGMLQAQALKYMLRLWLKSNAAQDAQKAQWYLNRLIEHLTDSPGEC